MCNKCLFYFIAHETRPIRIPYYNVGLGSDVISLTIIARYYTLTFRQRWIFGRELNAKFYSMDRLQILSSNLTCKIETETTKLFSSKTADPSFSRYVTHFLPIRIPFFKFFAYRLCPSESDSWKECLTTTDSIQIEDNPTFPQSLYWITSKYTKPVAIRIIILILYLLYNGIWVDVM